MAKKAPEYSPEGKPIWGRNEKGQPICYRKKSKKNGGGYCRSTILCANGRCRSAGHGGDAPGRPPTHGGRSAALAGLKLAEKFNTVVKDPELNSHRDNMATLEVLIQARLEQASPPAQLWARAIELYDLALSESQNCVQALRDLGPILHAGQISEESIAEAVQLMDHQRRHKLAESKREAELETTMSARQANAFMIAVMSIVKEEVPDLDIRARIAERVLRQCSTPILRGID